jgi:hypothetical protein
MGHGFTETVVVRPAIFSLSLALAACSSDNVPVEHALPSPAYAGASPCEVVGIEPDTTLTRAASGEVAVPVRIQLLHCGDRGWSYAFETTRQRGAGSTSLFLAPWVLLADLNFDGHADLWATGSPDGQGRVRVSDVWLFEADREEYVYAPSFSALENLDLAPAAERIEAGVWNCGCAGGCYYRDVYAVEEGALRRTRRYEQDCVALEGDRWGLLYREYEREGDSLRVTFETTAPNDTSTAFPEREPLEYVDYRRYRT